MQSHPTQPTIYRLDAATGEVIDKFGEDLMSMPHGITVTDDDHIWVTDVGLHQVWAVITLLLLLCLLFLFFYSVARHLCGSGIVSLFILSCQESAPPLSPSRAKIWLHTSLWFEPVLLDLFSPIPPAHRLPLSPSAA